jgi:hypothetical protein
LHTFELRADRAENASDVREFIGGRLTQLRLAAVLSEESQRIIAERLPLLANGNFLYARMALDALQEGTLSVDDFGFLSPGMSDFYVKAFSRLFPSEADFETEAHSILRVLSVAMGPLPFSIIDRASRLPKETEETTHRRLLRIKPYLHVSGERLDGARYALFHKSLADWLTNSDAAGSFWCSGDQGRNQLAEACWQDYENDPQNMTEYALRYAMHHLREVRRETEAKALSQDETFRQRRIKLGLSSFYLSYARGDDDAFVSRLHHDLVSQGFDIWFDRESMPGRGLAFLSDVKNAIDKYDRLVLVVGPKALKSDYVAAEWRHAATSGKAVTPVLRLGEYADLPRELRQYDILDVRDDARYGIALIEFARQVTEPLRPLGALVGVPPLPPSYVARPGLMDELMSAVLGGVDKPLIAFPVAVAATGMGGIGKTVLLSAFARAPEVRRAFPDGIYWLTLGPHPDLVALQERLLRMLGDATDVTSGDEGRARLRLLLADSGALIVLDDVWKAGDVAEFIQFGPRCRMVLSTRNADVGRTLGSKVLAVDVPSESDAAALLAEKAGVSVNLLPPAAHELIRMLGHHPLAIAMAGAMVRNGTSWIDLRNGIREGLVDLANPLAGYEHRTILSSIKVSYESLSKNERELLTELASALPKHSYLTVADVVQACANAVGLSQLETDRALSSLSDRALVRIEEVPSGERRITLHPLTHQFLSDTSRYRKGTNDPA